MASTIQPLSADALSGVPFAEKWELLKPVIEQLYLKENMKLPQLRQILGERYRFYANDSQYKYQINRKWEMRKNVPTSKMAAMVDMCLTRPALRSHGALKYKGVVVEDKKFRRHVKESSRALRKAQAQAAITNASTSFSPEASKIVLNWNMPYGAMRATDSRNLDHFSPFVAVSTPSDVAAATPRSNNVMSPQSIMPPLSQALQKKTSLNRAQLFLEGRHDELMKSMNKSERHIASNWLYQFWFFSFKTAKAWGRGPRRFNATNLAFDKYYDVISVSAANTPGASVEHEARQGFSPSTNRHIERARLEKPTDLCRWSVHTNAIEYGDFPDSPDEPGLEEEHPTDSEDEDSWSNWPRSWHQPDLPNVLRNGLETNDFSDVGKDCLPMSVSEVLKTTPRTPNEMLREAFAFSIMGRNLELVQDLTSKIANDDVAIADIHPLHLATTYLDGSKTCCNILDSLAEDFSQFARSSPHNDLGHTVLDNLMVTIMRSHTFCDPGFVDYCWAKEKRFPGADVDICGRWDADSDCIRSLLAAGDLSIPKEWKHKFCHTSAQTIIQCISVLDQKIPMLFKTPSGLFVKRCQSCGLKIELLPLHTIVVVSFAVAQYGLQGENLFGMIACLLCILSCGANPLVKVPASMAALLDKELDQCDHEMIDAAELALEFQSRFACTWSKEVAMGWDIIVKVLQRSKQQWDPRLRGQDELQQSPPTGPNATDLDLAFEAVYGVESGNPIFDAMDIDHPQVEEEDAASEACSSTANLQESSACNYWFSSADEHDNYFGKDRILGELWAAVRTEMLTYRRVSTTDAWNSQNFDMDSVHQSLQANDGLHIGLVEHDLMKDHCGCGFFSTDYFNFVTMEDVSVRYFANLEDYRRITIIPPPQRILANF